mmetsp:Transcript_32165/g.37229  ORF Transcript_32165/g.37229 Transcript_32165/m.37229 type:complete len:256 (-) Transcript_32165:242-1009(-)
MSSSAIRSLLSKTTRISTILPTTDALLGTELLLLESTRETLRQSYQTQLTKADSNSIVTTSLNTAVQFCHTHNLYQDMSRQNDITYYKVGRGKKGVDEQTGEEYSFETQELGYRQHIPRQMVSFGERLKFSGLLMELSVGILKEARDAAETETGPMVGASVFTGDGLSSFGLECLENQLISGAKNKPDVFCVNGVTDSGTTIDQLKEILTKNEPRMVRLSTLDTTGTYFENEEDTEIGFDIPVVIVREGQIDEIL